MKGGLMARVDPYHTIVPETPPERDVYHSDDKCPRGLEIEERHKRSGTAGRPLCKVCK